MATKRREQPPLLITHRDDEGRPELTVLITPSTEYIISQKGNLISAEPVSSYEARVNLHLRNIKDMPSRPADGKYLLNCTIQVLEVKRRR